MKTYLTYGLAMAGAGAVLALILFFLGLHSDPAKFSVAQSVQTFGGLAIAIACLILGIRARRSSLPETEAFTYGRALAAGTMIVLFATLFGTVFNLLYTTVIHPDYTEVLVQSQLAAAEQKGMPPEQLDQMESVMRMMSKPAIQAAMGLFFGFLFGFVVSLIVAIFMRRPAVVAAPEPPPIQA